MRYVNNHGNEFVDVRTPYAISLMQFSASLFTEIANICLICGQSTTMDVIMNFIALGIIAEIDDYYASSIKNFKLKEALNSLPVFKVENKGI